MVSEEASWILQATERCPDCEQLYAYELEVRCVQCDRPACPFCVVTLRGVSTCGGCDRGGCDGEEEAS